MNKLTKSLIVLAIGAVIWFLPVPSGITIEAWRIFAIFMATVFGFILQPFPFSVVSLLAIGIAATFHIMPIGAALKGYQSTVAWLILVAFLYSTSFVKTGLGNRIAYLLIKYMGTSSLRLAYILGLADIIIAPATPSNTARAGGIIYPIVKSVAEGFDSYPDKNPRKIGSYLMMSTFYSNTISSSMFMTSSASNPLLCSLVLSTVGIHIGWGLWSLAAFLPSLISYIFFPLYLYYLYPPEIKSTPEAKVMAATKLKELGPVSRSEVMTIFIFLISLLAWSTSTLTGIDPTAIAVLAVSVMLLTNVIEWGDCLKEKSAFDTFVWLGAMLSLADRMGQQGLFKWFSINLSVMFAHIPWPLTIALLTIFYCYTHYFFTGMTTHVVAMFVALLTVAVGAGTPPMLAALGLIFLDNLMAVLTHYGNGPAVVFFGSGYIKQTTWWKHGVITMGLLLIIWVGIGSMWWKVLGLW
ncbi:DASS family sodium-coupled anion symporter [Salmonella enterica]|nr:DASS family sodium-coupled anion symporter [Salmonella enterica subsp. enterica serovar Oranienburg]